jgi:hypothetical protein
MTNQTPHNKRLEPEKGFSALSARSAVDCFVAAY